MFDSPEARFAVDATREAAQLVRRVQREMVAGSMEKGDKSPVTVGDFAAQAVVAKRLSGAFPGVGLVGEESADELRVEAGGALLQQVVQFVQSVHPQASSGAVCDWIDLGASDGGDQHWTLDPIDGTKGFLRGDQYAVALALIRDGRVEVGALGCPELERGSQPRKGGEGSLLLAVRGHGAFSQPLDRPDDPWERVTASRLQEVAQARLLRSVEKGHTNINRIDLLIERLGILAEQVPMDSQAKYAVLAAGGAELLIRLLSPDRPDYREKIWDQAAGALVIEEAGGRVTDLDGKRLDFSHGRTLASNRGVLATNGLLHDTALEALSSLGY